MCIHVCCPQYNDKHIPSRPQERCRQDPAGAESGNWLWDLDVVLELGKHETSQDQKDLISLL